MKYKNIYSAIRNFGHSFMSLMNYVDETYVIDELTEIMAKGHDIEIDWLNNTFTPQQMANPSITKSMDSYHADLKNHLQSQNVDLTRLKSLKLYCPAQGKNYMWAEDDRGKDYKIYIS